MAETPVADSKPHFDRAALGQIVLVLQGGGALGAYQAGVYQALSEAGIEPDWVIGTSIGAINAGIIAGNVPEKRLERLRNFWTRVQGPLAQFSEAAAKFAPWAASTMTTTLGVPGFYEPNPWALLPKKATERHTALGLYSTKPLERSLEELIDPAVLKQAKMRLTVAAANVRTGEMRYFDSREAPLTVAHVMASSALPPAFPAICIDDELYWDGGIISNTPIEAVFDDNPRKSGLVFAVHLWSPSGAEPDSFLKILSRQKELQFSSRDASHIARQKQLHRLRHVIRELAGKLPKDVADTKEMRHLAAYGCFTRMHVVRLMAPSDIGDGYARDIDFSPSGITQRWDAGYNDTMHVLMQAPWAKDFDPLEGLILHETEAGKMMFQG